MATENIEVNADPETASESLGGNMAMANMTVTKMQVYRGWEETEGTLEVESADREWLLVGVQGVEDIAGG